MRRGLWFGTLTVLLLATAVVRAQDKARLTGDVVDDQDRTHGRRPHYA